MTRTENDLVTSLENRVRAMTDTIQQLFTAGEAASLTIHSLETQNAFLRQAVELLSMPRITNDDVRFVRDSLAQLAGEPVEEIRH